MVFTRTTPRRRYRDYRRYRNALRADFLYRCAYCLRHEYFFGGDAHGAIDHFRPQNGAFARPDLANDYNNLYWTCAECNQNKGDTWQTPDEESRGERFLDPCDPADDHDRHIRIEPDGTATPLTPAGRFTVDELLLWRESLRAHRARYVRWQQMHDELSALLAGKAVPADLRPALESQLSELGQWINPPVYHRSHRADSKTSGEPE